MTASRRILVGGQAWTCCRCRLLSTSSDRRPSQKLPTTPVRTRFAPSPTGYLHLGSLRTALFNYLTAKATGGQFILRVEDTDKKRTVEDAESRLYQDLKWAGLQWDEGPDIGGPYGPYKQSERTPLHKTHAETLLDSGHAYRCFCSTERLKSLAKERFDLGIPIDYDRTCISVPKAQADERAAKGESHIVRLKVPDVPPVYNDLVYGAVGRRRKPDKLQSLRTSYEDPVLIKSDGLPTYHLANVVDDHLMGITHVIRAAEWMSSTPKHMVMYNAFDWEPPTFAHVGLLQDPARQKLSKRDLATNIRGFEANGFFAEALVNFVALFGWSHKLDDDFLGLQDLVKIFDLKFTKGNTIASPNKLIHLQKRYAEKYVKEGGKQFESMIDKLHTAAEQYFAEHPGTQICSTIELKDRLTALLKIDAVNYITPKEFFERNIRFFCSQPREAWKPHSDDYLLEDSIDIVKIQFKSVSFEDWSEANLKRAFSQIANVLSAKWDRDSTRDSGPDLVKSQIITIQRFLRWALFGGRPGPVLMATMRLLGRDESLRRIGDAATELDAVLTERKAT